MIFISFLKQNLGWEFFYSLVTSVVSFHEAGEEGHDHSHE